MQNDGFTCVANTIFKLLWSYLHVIQTLCLHHNYKWSKDDEYCLYSIFTLTANTKQKKCFLRFDDLCTKSKLHVCRYLHSVANAKKIQLYCGSKYKVKDGFAWMPKTIFASLWSCLRRSQMSCLTIVCKESIAGKILNLLFFTYPVKIHVSEHLPKLCCGKDTRLRLICSMYKHHQIFHFWTVLLIKAEVNVNTSLLNGVESERNEKRNKMQVCPALCKYLLHYKIKIRSKSYCYMVNSLHL